MASTSKLTLLAMSAAVMTALFVPLTTPAHARDGDNLFNQSTQFLAKSGAKLTVNTLEAARAGQDRHVWNLAGETKRLRSVARGVSVDNQIGIDPQDLASNVAGESKRLRPVSRGVFSSDPSS